ncbi:flagellin [Pontibacillus yanchengensis]|uniref:flagellin N-terminal helical domain-containing protein n=1 Tax=Pontibacillus yanchengensis TaxID=462910 RepID=UPI00192565DF|nr:flagellin [Pontibacillus yanchengensis]
MRINHNIAALNTQRQLGQANKANQQSMEKLSSGLRINKAGDDAAGLAISEKMRGQIRGLEQAQRNSQDGISMIQTAEGALNETHSILQRMRELAVQSSNDTNTTEDRAELQKEVDQLSEEITRISNNTEFNTQNLLNGGIDKSNLGEVKFQIGANNNQNLGLEIGAMDAETLGVARDVITGTENGSEVSDSEITGSSGAALVDGANITLNSADNTGSKASVQLTSNSGESITIEDNSASSDSNNVKINLTQNSSDTLDVTKTGDTINIALADTGASKNNASLIQSAIQGLGSVNGVNVDDWTVTDNGTWDDNTTDTGESGALSLSGGVDSNSAETIVTLDDGNGKTQKVTVQDTDKNVSVGSGNFQGLSFDVNDITNLSSGADSIDISSTSSKAATFAGGEKTADATVAGGIDISSQSSANSAIDKINGAIESVSTERSKLGAYQNRLEHTINNLGTSAENLTAAESRIRDVDYASAA